MLTHFLLFERYYKGEKKAPILTIVIGGNHEASNYMQELPYGGWLAPNIYYLGMKIVIFHNIIDGSQQCQSHVFGLAYLKYTFVVLFSAWHELIFLKDAVQTSSTFQTHAVKMQLNG